MSSVFDEKYEFMRDLWHLIEGACDGRVEIVHSEKLCNRETI